MKGLHVWLSILLALTAALVTVLWVMGREPPPVLSQLRQIYIPEPVIRATGHEPAVAKVIYLNREGARLLPGPDDARFNRSSIVQNHSFTHLDVPAYQGPAKRWDATVACIRKHFSLFDVAVVDRRPVQGDYLMAVIGGRSEKLVPRKDDGHEHRGKVTGLAPYDGKPINDAVVLIFAETLKNEMQAVCETTAMEVAHAYGLDHTFECRDLMTYRKRCGARSFVDKDMDCGEYESRVCGDGQPTQNSRRRLVELLGPGGGRQ